MALSSTGQLTLFRAVGRASPLAMNCHARPGGSGIGFVSHGGPFVGLQVRRSSLPPLNPQSAMPPPPSCQELALFHTACCRVRGEAVPALSSTANWLCFAPSSLAANVTFALPRPRFPTFPTFGFVSHNQLLGPWRGHLGLVFPSPLALFCTAGPSLAHVIARSAERSSAATQDCAHTKARRHEEDECGNVPQTPWLCGSV